MAASFPETQEDSKTDGGHARARATPSVGLLVTCLVDLFRPSVGFAAVKLLEDAGCSVEAPEAQTCCGQPAYNSGDRANAAAIARHVIETFEPFNYVVAPSASCIGMLRHGYPELLKNDPEFSSRAESLAAKSFELTSFLTGVLGVKAVSASYPGSVTYHDSCSSLRELKITDPPRTLLASVKGLQLIEMKETEICCGFGGTFCVKYPAIATSMVEGKCRNIAATDARCVLAGDLGCLLHIAGRLSRDGSPVEVRHVAEVLAGMTDIPAIGHAPRQD